MTSDEIAALVNRASGLCESGQVAEALQALDTAVEADRTFWPALYNRVEIHAALATSLETGADLSSALYRWSLAVADAEHVAELRPDLAYGHLAEGKAKAAKARLLDVLGRPEQAEAQRREGHAAYNRALGVAAPDSEEWQTASRNVIELREALTGTPPPGQPSDLKARAEYNRIGILIEALSVQHGADWMDSDHVLPEGSPSVIEGVLRAADPRQYVADRLRNEVPGWCTKGLSAKAWLGNLAYGYDKETYDAGQMWRYVRRLYDGGFLQFDEAPYLHAVLRKVEMGTSPPSVLRDALEAYVPVYLRLLQHCQIEE